MKKSSSALKVTPHLGILRGETGFAPYVSVFFLMVLFVMISLLFVQISGIKVELPSTVSANYAARKYVVTIAPGGKIYFNDTVIPMESLRTKLAELRTREAPAIILRADASVPYDSVARVMGIAEENGSSVILLTAPPKTHAPAREE